MKDTIIKGTGNSRSIKAPPNLLTLYPTWEAAAQAMIDGTFPIDLGPLNPAGVQVMGTELNKPNLLKDQTAARYGLPATAVPDDVLVKVRELITAAQTTANAKAVIYTGSYTGTGTAGPDHPCQITFPAAPKLVLMPSAYSTDGYIGFIAVNVADLTTDYQKDFGLGKYQSTVNGDKPYAKKSADGKILYWYSIDSSSRGNAHAQCNMLGTIYRWIAFA